MRTNNYLIKQPFFSIILIFVSGIISLPETVSSQSIPETDKLLSRLDLSKPELEKVKQSANNPEQAAGGLLEFFRNRTSVKHFVDRKAKTKVFENYASENDFQVANNALKHIFVGQSAYPPYFCGDDINWGTRPVPDNEWVWQLNRMYFWTSMGKAYWHTGDEKYAKEWCRQLVDWTRKNPNDSEHQYAWRSIEAGIRGHSWTNLYQYFIDSPNFTPEVLVAFLNSLYDHAEFLMTKYRSSSNWGLMEAEGMAFIAMSFPEFTNSSKWLEEAVRRLNNEINFQVYPDGHQRELAIGYHLGCIEWFVRTYDLALANGKTNVFPPEYIAKIEKMCEVPMKICHPNGTNAQFGDAWAGQPGQHRKRFEEWAERFNRKDFLYFASAGKKGVEPKETAFALPYSGLYSMRSSWSDDAICMVLKCGPDGGGHCQPDNGTFELSAGGRTLMPDGGSYIYSGDPENRAWFRQTKVHQTLTLDGKNSKYAPQLLLWNPGKATDMLVVENQSYDNLKHRRSVFFVEKKYFVIVDEAFGDATGDIDLHFQLAPGEANFDYQSHRVASDFSEGWNIFVQALKPENIELEKEEGQVSFLYTKKEPRPAFCYHVNKKVPEEKIQFITLVQPYLNSRPELKVRLLNEPGDEPNELQLEIEENGRLIKVGYSLK